MISYKDVIKSRKLRLKLLKLFSFLPDKQMVQLQYRIKFHRKLNLKNPQRFTEKLQWYKLYYRDPLMGQCVDKYAVREYVRKCGLEEILVPLIGIYEKAEEVDIDSLPETFVAKDTLGTGGSSVVLCKEKRKLDIPEFQQTMKEWVANSTSERQGGREWVYGGKKHRIIIEEMLPSKEEEGGLIDYKFFCFYGVPTYTYILADRNIGNGASLGIFEAKTFKKLDAVRCDESPLKRDIPKPDKYDQMLRVAEKLSNPFPEARIDLYCVDGHIYFGEITFFDGSGYMSFEPDEFDLEMGKCFRIGDIC